jgi:hypothetical protein
MMSIGSIRLINLILPRLCPRRASAEGPLASLVVTKKGARGDKEGVAWDDIKSGTEYKLPPSQGDKNQER